MGIIVNTAKDISLTGKFGPTLFGKAQEIHSNNNVKMKRLDYSFTNSFESNLNVASKTCLIVNELRNAKEGIA